QIPDALVRGIVSKQAYAFNEGHNGGVPLTLSSTAASGVTYSSVSVSDGSFSFFVPAGEYTVSIGGGYEFVTHPLSGSPLQVTTQYDFSSTISIRPSAVPSIQVQGNISKQAFALDESNQGGVNLTLTATDASGRIYSAITDDVGYFAFMVPPGQYDLSVSGLYRLQNNPFPGNPINVIPGFSFPNTINVVPTKVEWHVTGVVSKEAKAFGETDEAGVNLTLTSQATNVSYSAISDSLGQFSFVVPPGNYDFAVGGGYKFKNAFANPLSVNADISFGTAFVVVPSNGVFFNVTGNIQKSPRLPGETDESGVEVQLKSADVNAPILETKTSSNGFFRFQVPAQTYSLMIDGSYELSLVPAAVSVTADYNYGTLVVNPSTSLKARIYGVISPANLSDTYEVRLWDYDNSKYIKTVNSVPGTGEYSFSDVPLGNFQVFALPLRNGYFAESGVISVGPGASIQENLSASPVSPNISAHTFTSINLLDLVGNRFFATSVDPAETEVFVDGNPMTRPNVSDLTDTQDRADLSNVTPGKHKAVLKKNWTLAATGQNFVLSSNEINIDKPIGAPTNLVWREVKDTEIEVAWKNAPFTQSTEVEIWDVLTSTQVGTTVTVSETFYEFTGLAQSTNYEVRLRNRAGNVVSLPLTGTNSTKSAAAYQVQTISLVDSGNLLSQGTALDFVAAEGKFFVAHTQSTDLYITGYSADGTASQSQLVFASAAAPSFTDVSMVYGGGLLFICYRNSTQIDIQSFNTNLVPQNSISMPGIYSEAQMIYAGSKLFVVCTVYPASSQHDLFEIASPATLSGMQSIETVNTTLSDDFGHLALVAADESTNSLYFVAPYTNLSSNDSFLIKRYDIDNPLSTSSDLCVIPSNITGYGIAVHQFKVGGGRIMLRCGNDSSGIWTNRLYFIDQKTGSTVLKSADY
ncbi:MAG: fibronectin type III domain-containing protein, partial [Candidatus Rifleibacteriota bacterium]